ncbi:MAG TPA: hypothetical protein VFJ85_08315 [Acidimicrobiales bacterium]|nr:hypothetical protein [Acidimicrobiales bacterium]
MITGWLTKIVISIVLAGVIVAEVLSPLVTRAQIDGVAHDAANNAAIDLLDHNDAERAREVAQEIADDNHVFLKAFTIDNRGVVVTVEKEAWSLGAKKWDKIKNRYDVKVTATARGKR